MARKRGVLFRPFPKWTPFSAYSRPFGFPARPILYPPFQREVQHPQVVDIVVKNRRMMRCGQETTTVPMRRNEETCYHDQKLPSLDLRRTIPGKDSKEERTFKGLDCATPDPHLRSDYTLTGMRTKCCTSDWKWGFLLFRISAPSCGTGMMTTALTPRPFPRYNLIEVLESSIK